MSNWTLMRLDQLGKVERGRSRHRPRNDPALYGGPYPLVQTGDVKEAGLRLYNHTQTYNETGLAQSRLWPVGTLCFTIAANIGDTAILGIPACFPDSIVGFTPYPDKADTVFVKYALEYTKLKFSAISKGATQDNLSLEKLLSQDLLVPQLETQRRIASILGAYDDLIEVNRRRVKLLEEMACSLFESLINRSASARFDSLLLGDIVASSLGGDWGEEEPNDECVIPVRVIRGTDFSRLAMGDFSSCPLRYITKSSAIKRMLRPSDVVLENSINAKTRSAGSTLLVTGGILRELGESVIAASFCRVFKFNSTSESVACHLWCRYLHQTREIERYQIVAANGIANFQTTTFLRDCKLRVDLKEFPQELSALNTLMSTLYAEQIGKLAAARDLLLPRLISGQLSVEATEPMLAAAE